jgi:MFS family permease
LIIGDAGRAVALLTIPIAYAFDALTLLQLYIVVLITGVLTVFFDVAYQAYLPALVDRNQIADGNGKLQMSESGAQIAGPGIAGALVQALGAPAAVVTDAASFVVSAAAVVWIRKPEPEIERPAAATEASDAGDAESSMRADIAEGVRYVVNNPYLRAIAACTSSSNLFSSMMFAVFVLYEVRVLGFSPGVIGAVFAVSNIGFLVGAAVCTRITRALGLGRTIVTSIVVGSVGTLLIPLAPHDGAIPWFVAAGVLMSFGQPVYNINQVSFRQAITPHRLQGRMNATMRFLVWGTMPIGSLLGGALGATIGLHPTVWVAALGGLLPILPVTLSPVRSLVSMPDQVDEPEDGEPSTPVVMEVGPAGPVIEVPTDE